MYKMYEKGIFKTGEQGYDLVANGHITSLIVSTSSVFRAPLSFLTSQLPCSGKILAV